MDNFILKTAFNRLDELHRAFHNAISGYHNQNDFRAAINSAIQSSRNITFALQSQKNNLNNFDNWYIKWQDLMKEDEILKKLVTARNIIVKEKDLELYSTGIARIKGWIDFNRLEFKFNPTLDTRKVAQDIYNLYFRYALKEDLSKDRLIFEFQRKWIYDSIPNTELIDIIAYSYNFFSDMLFDASQFFGLENLENIKCNYCEKERNKEGNLKCMVMTNNEKSLYYTLDSLYTFTDKSTSINFSDKNSEKAKKRYWDLLNSKRIIDLTEDLFLDIYPFNMMKTYAQVALSCLKKDKHLYPMYFLFDKDGKNPPIHISPIFNTQQEKILAIDKVCDKIIKNKSYAVFISTEAWLYNIKKRKGIPPTHNNHKNTRECVSFSCIFPNKLKIINIPFKRTLFGTIRYLQPTVESFSTKEEHNQFILIPIIKALQDVN